MNNNRRSFIKKLGIATAALAVNPLDLMAAELPEPTTAVNKPIVLEFRVESERRCMDSSGKRRKSFRCS
jgi:hypothetical protein